MLEPWTVLGLGVAVLFIAVPGIVLLLTGWLFACWGSKVERPQPPKNALPDRRVPGGKRE